MHKQFSKGILCFLCLLVALSFFATLVPIAGASNDTMPCCVGKTAGHCDSGITPKKIPLPEPEPMCGLDNSDFADDPITIVAESSQNESHHSLSQTAETTSHAAESIAISKECQMECGACTSASSRQQRREKVIAEAKRRHTSPSSSISFLAALPVVFSSNAGWSHISKRGPPEPIS